ncbi:TetR family transcriptional regulator [Rhodoblastus sphagnicola]|uniref:TetR family transcriptional regulator n=1 Tax=Rhodoblastus sphagnicola TaxID=333368 RepID=A0A2S6N0S2_9HYPH|nr:TetR/AcrR family transcriptional regulator [Rhodoblastus sphagnicola]MBB4200456.1 AcrR family transcriptional regulator [Rhodoblastus sphagnicola]PPQ28186.1 TetR family transcriptional regulator [Rhodoblastus sphagnicola]
MENSARSQRTRAAAIQAALTIITRDGPGRLTIDAIARECGSSKGGILHHFRTKDAVLKALLEHQIEQGESLFDGYLAQSLPGRHEPALEAEIESLRTAAAHPKSTTFAIASALADNPELIAAVREREAKHVEAMKKEAADPSVAMVRWSAARGLALSSILGLCPLSEQERMSLFDLLRDDALWDSAQSCIRRRKEAAPQKEKQLL